MCSMDRVDIESIEDINDLEARLYAHVHHEPLNPNNNNNESQENHNNGQGNFSKFVSKALSSKLCYGHDLDDQSNELKNDNVNLLCNPIAIAARKTTAFLSKEKNIEERKLNDKVQRMRSKIIPSLKKGQQKQWRSQNDNLMINPFRKCSSSLRINPIAVNNRKHQTKDIDVLKAPPFEKRRILKLQKRKSMQNKRLIKNLKINKAERKFSNEGIIQIDSTDESDSSDVIIIPSTTPPIISIDESDNDDCREKNKALVSMNNLCSASSVQIANANILSSATIREEQLQNSRCTSPCSILSANDFIEQRDRTQNDLLFTNRNSGADDADLLLLTAEVKNLNGINNNYVTNEVENTNIESEANRQHRQLPKEFAHLEDNEQEEETDSYTSPLKKPSLINVIDSDSETTNNVGKISMKRSLSIRKRKLLIKYKDHEKNDALLQDDSDDTEESDVLTPKKRRSRISYIVQGPAIEQCSSNKRIFNVDENNRQSRCSSSFSSYNNVSNKDKEFIKALNNLIQGSDTATLHISDDEILENAQDILKENDISESALNKRTERETSVVETLIDKETAVPADIVDKLSYAFKTIDQQFEQGEQNMNDGDQDIQVLEEDNCNSTLDASDNRSQNAFEDGSPIYNVTFIDRNDLVYGQFTGLGWNEEMTKFYNNSWNGELFQLNRILHKMNPDKNLWKIYSEDRFNKPMRRNLKCTNCCEFGHIRSKCRRPRKPIICYMCGERGHYEPRCPNTICLRCGNKTRVFMKSCNACIFQNYTTCPICKVRGHSIDLCPDKWRRYHSTIEPNVHPNHSVQYNNKKYCCVCGVRGHLAENCRNAVRLLEYPVTVSTIKSHAKSYADLMKKSSSFSSMLLTPTSIGVNLMYKPFQEFQFKLALNTEKNKVYGRFLTAVGMSSLLLHSKKPINYDLSQRPPNQVPEVSASQKNDTECISVESSDQEENKNDYNDDFEIIISNPESKSRFRDSIQLNVIDGSCNLPRSTCSTIVSEAQLIDSDSNYSFSEHFDVNLPSTSTKEMSTNNEYSEVNDIDNDNANDNIRMPEFNETLPDFIPLIPSRKNKCTNKQDNDNLYNSTNSDDDNNPPPPPPLSSEAKIYLTYDHSKYLLSLEGHNFIEEMAKTYNVKARVDVTSVGHVLIINGLDTDQDKFYKNLLIKYDKILETEAKYNLNCTVNSVPKRVDALIRFLRDNINQLQCKLGNVNDLYRRLKCLEKLHSKGNIKQADKTRRLLNMILLGQAGLLGGHVRINKLLEYLKCLLNDHVTSEEMASNKLRNDIIENWKMIFTSYRHDNYEQLVQMYNKLLTQDRLPKLDLNPVLLGHKILNANMNTNIKKINNQSSNNYVGKDRNKIINSLNGNKISKTVKTHVGVKNFQYPKKYFINSTYNSNMKRKAKIVMNKSINTNGKSSTYNSVATVENSKRPSPYWSKKCLRYLDGCIQHTSNQAQLLEKLQRVRNKANSGELSYNDYLAVIKLHKALLNE